MARLILPSLLFAAIAIASCAAPHHAAAERYARGVKYYSFGAYDEARDYFEQAAATGWYIPGTEAAIGQMMIRQGDVAGGLTLLEKEYLRYRDPLIGDYIGFVRRLYGLDAAAAEPAEERP